jgi:T4-like virus Myoviridae tail sheath stabiliser
MANVFYNRIIRKLVVGFGNMFNDITLVRYNPDFTEAERMIVPIIYGPKEPYVFRMEEDPTLGKKVQVTLPRMSFELNGFTYDASRKQNTNVKQFAQTTNGLISQYNPVPYNFDFSLYVYVRNIEDGTQIMEHILSYFTPDYTIKLNLVPEMGIVKEIPVVLNSTSQEIDAEGDWERGTRNVIWTLNFTAKGFIFGKINDASKGVITHSITSIFNEIDPHSEVQFVIDSATGVGNYQVGEIVYQGYSRGTAIATAKVIFWSNNILHLTDINGNFVSNLPINASSSQTSYKFTSYIPSAKKQVQIDIVPNPADANVASNWTANTTITELPN